MELTREQIQELYAFTKKHHVEWYDLQTELVDHLANDIEQIWKENSKLTFEQARKSAYKKFGIMGFGDVIEKKQKALRKRYWKLIWHFFKSYFKLPKIILTFLLIGIVFSLFNSTANTKTLITIGLALIFIIPVIFVITKSVAIKKRYKLTGKKWLFQNSLLSLGGLTYFAQIPIQLYLSTNYSIHLTYTLQLLISILFVLIGIFIYISIKIIPSKMEETIAKEYPEYKVYG
tara:strand:+ start:317924 stop:318619 length:696 start_codon:yes stop_codon:yes gene_type:complete